MIELAFCQLLILRFSRLCGIAGQTYGQKVVDRWVSVGLFRFRFETLVYLLKTNPFETLGTFDNRWIGLTTASEIAAHVPLTNEAEKKAPLRSQIQFGITRHEDMPH
jgi:hypothetical protein